MFHWLLVLSFAGAFVTAESERWLHVHVTLGYTVAGLVAFRLLWGLVGTRHARFSAFVRGPGAVLRHLRGLVRGQPEHHTGHNPAGAWGIVALLTLALLVAASGWALYRPAAGHALEELHEGVANLMLGVVFVHVLAVLVTGWIHGENLVLAMLTGRKAGPAQEGIRRPWRALGALLLAAVLGYWALQGATIPATKAATSPTRDAPQDDD
jgi:cytochrome b